MAASTATATVTCSKERALNNDNDGPLFWSPSPQIVASKVFAIAEQSSVLLVDVSLSTSGPIIRDQKKVCDRIVQIARQTCSIVGWGSFARVHDTVASLCPTGATDPSCIYTNMTTLRPVLQSQVHWMFTDGAISPHNVPDLARNVSNAPPTNAVVVLTVGGSSIQRASSLPISVVISYLEHASSAIVLVRLVGDQCDAIRDGDPVLRVIRSKGAFADKWKSAQINDDTTLEQLEMVTIGDIMQVKTRADRGDCAPRGHVSVGANRYLNIDAMESRQLSADEQKEVVAILSDSDKRSELIVSCKTRGCLSQLRTAVQRIEANARRLAKMPCHLKALTSREARLVGLMRREQDKNSVVFLEWQKELRKLRVQLATAQSTVNKLFQETVRPIVSVTQQTLALVTRAEGLGFNAGIHGQLNQSNRALRAKDVDLEEIASIELNTNGAYSGECAICCEASSVLCILLKKLPLDKADMNIRKKQFDGSPALGDTIQNMPLAFGSSPHNQNLLPDHPVCRDCAKSLEVSSHTREQLQGYIPLVALDSRTNRDVVLAHISTALANGKIMHVWWLLFAAILDYNLGTASGFCDADHPELRSALEYMLKEIVTKVRTLKNMQEGCEERVSIIEAIAHVLGGCPSVDSPATPYNQRYFLNGLMCMSNLMRFSAGGILDNGSKVIHRALMKNIVMHHMSFIKNNYVAKNERRIAFYERAFKCRYGVPVEKTGRLITLDVLLETLSVNTRSMLEIWCRKNGTDIKSFIKLPAATLVLWELVHTKNHDKSDSWIAAKCENHALLNACFEDPASVSEEEVIEFINASFSRQAIDAVHAQPGQFGNVPWASVLHCMDCGYQFIPDDCKEKDPEKLALIVRERRTGHFQAVYNVNAYGNPCRTSSSYKGNKIVAETFDPNKSDEENVQAAIKKIVSSPSNGNIHRETMEVVVARMVASFRPLYPLYKEKFAGRQVPLSEKIQFELSLQ